MWNNRENFRLHSYGERGESADFFGGGVGGTKKFYINFINFLGVLFSGGLRF